MNTALLWMGGLIVAFFCALFAIPHVVDWDRYRGVFEEEASRMVGRDVRVGGAVMLRFLPAPYIQFDKIKVADGERGSGEAFFRADGLTVWLSIAPLLRGAIEAHDIELKKPNLLVKVDQDGRPNWRTLKLSAANLPFVPTEVSLRSLRISDGAITVRGEGDRELAYMKAINGEVSADALEGPYKFRGELDWNGEPREIRLSTAALDPSGRLRTKLTVKAVKSGGSYVFDGALSDIALSPKLQGELTAKLPIELEGSGEGPSATSRASADKAIAPGVELKAQIAGTPAGVKLDDIALSFEQAGQPQLIAGSLSASWAGQPRLDATLDSRWLDLDKIIGNGESASPLSTAHALLTTMSGLIPDQTQLRAGLKIDQVTLGGDTVSGIALTLVRRTRELEIEDFRAALPGGTKIDLAGVLASGREADSFKGEIAVRGASLQRFATWLARGQSIAEARADRPFALQSMLQLSRRSVEFTGATGEFAGSSIAGRIRYAWAGRKQLALDVESSAIDLTGIFPGALSLSNLREIFWPVPESGVPVGSSVAGRWLDPATADVSLGVRAGTLTDGHQQLREVALDVRLQNRTLVIADMRFKSAAGLHIEAEGQVADNSGKPKGIVRGLVAAPGPEASAELSRLWGSEPLGGESAPGEFDLAPLRMAGSISYGSASATSVDVTADGLLRGSRVTGSVRLNGGFESWPASAVDASATVDSSDVARLLRPLFASKTVPGQARERRSAVPPAPGRLSLKASGVPADGVVALVRLDAPGFDLSVNGRGTWDGSSLPKFAGELNVDTPDAAQALAMVGWAAPAGAVGIGVHGQADIELSDGLLLFVPRGTKVGGDPLAGFVSIRPEVGQSRFEARLATREVSLTRLLGLVTEPAGQSVTETDAALGPWPDQPFDFGILSRASGKIALEANRLNVAEGLSLNGAVVEAELGPRVVQVTKLEGEALGGRFSSALTLTPVTAGAELKLEVKTEGVRLASLRPRRAGGSEARGTASIVLSASGRGATPRGLINTLAGSGQAELTTAAIGGLSPAAIGSAIDSLFASRPDPGKDNSRPVLISSLEPGSLPLASRSVRLEISDGAMRLDPFSIEEPRGRVTNRTTVELATLKIDSEWSIEPKLPVRSANAARAFLPAINVVYVGALRDVARLEPKISTEALERELIVRKMELDVDELERVRRQDEERVKLETERLRAIESDRQGVRPEQVPPQGWGATPYPAPVQPPPGPRRPPGPTVTPEPAPAESGPRSVQPQGRSDLTNAPAPPGAVTGTRWYDAPEWRKGGSPITGKGGN